jgi:methyl-accepting chemotaxis protein
METDPDGSQTGASRTLMDGSVPGEQARTGPLARLAERVLGRRRNYLVDPSYQVRSAIIAVLGMAFLLVFASALFHLLNAESARFVAHPASGAQRAAGTGELRSVLYLLAVGLFFVAAVFAIEIFETHKTAGVVHKVTRGLREIEAGRWATRVSLRKNDNFKEMEEAFNSAAQALRRTLDQDLHGLQGIEGQVRLISREFESGNREGALVLLRRIAAELQFLRERKRNLMDVTSAPPASPK